MHDVELRVQGAVLKYAALVAEALPLVEDKLHWRHWMIRLRI